MANTCLQTKLKSVVQNDNLPILDTICIVVKGINNPTDAQYKLTLRPYGTTTLTIDGDGWFRTSDDITEVTTIKTKTVYASENIIRFSPGNYKILITPKYDSIKYAIFPIGAYIEDVSDLKYSDATMFQFNSANVVYSVEQIVNSININTIETLSFTSNIEGNIALFSKCSNLISLGLTSSLFSIQDLENLVAAYVAGGKTSNTTGINLPYCTNRIKFNGTNCVAKSNYVLTWTASGDNTEVTLDGSSTTIHVNSDGTWNRVS